MNIMHKSLALGIVVAAGVGCASAALPAERLASTEASVRAAQEVGAQNEPRAQLHLRLATEELAAARKFAANGDDDLGAQQLDRAKADAELAVALSREATAEQELHAAGGGVVSNPDPAIQAVR
jgi:hypothetical protein